MDKRFKGRRNIARETGALMALDPFIQPPAGLEYTSFSNENLFLARVTLVDAIATLCLIIKKNDPGKDPLEFNDGLNEIANYVRKLQQIMAVMTARDTY